MKIGVIVPCRDDAVPLRRCLASLSALESGLAVPEVLVVLDRCKDDSLSVAQAFRVETAIKSSAAWRNSTAENLNIGMKRFQDYDYVLVVAADTVLASRYLSLCLSWLEENAGLASVAGSLFSNDGLYRGYQIVMERIGLGHGIRGTGRVYRGSAIRRVSEEYGTVFRDCLAEDSELDRRLGKAETVPGALMYETRAFSLSRSVLRQVRQGRARRQLGVPLRRIAGEVPRFRWFVLLGYLLPMTDH